MEDKRLLNTIKSPNDLKKLNNKQLEILCAQIREELISTVSKNGGHLASNLGVVELTVALHKAFDCPNDKIVFDVGHQCYPHKMLTGRLDRFASIRTKEGLSGFPRPDESEYDAFIAGHSSTSVSAGFGLSEAKQIKKEDGFVVAVIGDGALSGGLAYEALNNAGRSHSNLIVILNDNKMSISKNVGAMSRYLAVIRSRPKYYKFKIATDKVVSHIPLIGKHLRRFLFGVKSGIKSVLYNSTIFEDMGFAYLGPIDGHDLNKLDTILTLAKTMKRPALIHINTVKGKGYGFAEKDPNIFHGVSSFDIETGERISAGDNFSSEFGKCLCEIADEDNRICGITAAMCESTGLDRFKHKFKNRFFDVGIAEQHAVTFASGLSISGLVPVFAVYSTFLQRAYDQIIHDAAIQNLKLVLGIDRAGVVGEDGETHQGVFDVAFLNSIPNVTVYSPCTYEELKIDLNNSVYKDSGVCAVRYPRGKQSVIPDDFVSTGMPYDVYGSKGSSVAVITYGRTFSDCAVAQKKLENDGIAVKIIKLNRIKPIDDNAVNEALDCSKLFFFEEGMKIGGVSEHFAAMCYEKGYKGDISITAINDVFVPHATVCETLNDLHLDSESIYQKIKGECGPCQQ